MDRKWSAYSHDGNDPNGRGAKVVGSPRERHRWNRGQKAAFASGFSGVCTENLNPDVVMVKSTKYRR
jgi:hypothetical protein